MALGKTNNAIRSTSRGNSLRDLTAAILPMDEQASDIQSRAQAVAEIAAAHAGRSTARRDSRPKRSRPPKEQRLLGILVPVELGGEGASISDVVDVCYVLGRACASTAMIYAMHQIMVACLVRHAAAAPGTRAAAAAADEQLLLASSTTEGQGGGDLRKSDAPSMQDGARFALEQDATVMSYGAQADGIVTTARRAPDAPATDQVLVALAQGGLRARAPVGLGHAGHARHLQRRLHARGRRRRSSRSCRSPTRDPCPHHGAGRASDLERGVGRHRRRRGRTRPALHPQGGARPAGQLPPGAAHLTRATASLRVLRATRDVGAAALRSAPGRARRAEALDFQTAMNLLKVNASELAIATVMTRCRPAGSPAIATTANSASPATCATSCRRRS